jgi:rSAM/selenodomain-associated transferase 2/rSAM/selenodomain-associated transferase 1
MPELPSDRLLIFTRYPGPGSAKTRLIPALGREGAADLQRQMTEHVLGEVRKLLSIHPASIRVCFDGGGEEQMKAWLGPEWRYLPQGSGDLGQRMAAAFERAFREGSERVVLIGTDVPDLTAPVLYRAFRALESGDLVLGPAEDGGYYLIGLDRSAWERAPTRLFSGVTWGTSAVLDQTLRIADGLGLSPTLTARLADVDLPGDLGAWDRRQRAKALASEQAWISVVIPTLDEVAGIERTLGSIPEQEYLDVIIADGGSTDGTPERARARGVRVVSSAPPRSRQMNLGAAAARGSIYLFLHADTLLPEGFAERVRRATASPSTAAGAFALKIDSDRAGISLVERATNLRSRYLSLPYGDQALFVPARRFWELGGFPLLPIMEDFALVRRLARSGRIVLVDLPVVTSGRRWDRLGIVRTTLINQLMVLGYYLGVAPETLSRWYRRSRPARS